ncbi:recombination protein NinB [Luteimonas sp. RIT-PG2_3]
MSEQWKEMLTEQQRKILNAACGDLAEQITWYGQRLSKDDFRHFIAGTVLGWRMLPGINRGEGAPGFVMLGGSSMSLTKQQCIDAITIAFSIGDQPWEYEPSQTKAVRWCEAVCKARWLTAEAA